MHVLWADKCCEKLQCILFYKHDVRQTQVYSLVFTYPLLFLHPDSQIDHFSFEIDM